MTKRAPGPGTPLPTRANFEEDVRDALRRQSALSRIPQRTHMTAELVVPAVPALVDRYVEMLADQFASLGRAFSAEELRHLRELLLGKLEEGFRVSPYSNVMIRYNTAPYPSVAVSYGVAASLSSTAEEYAHWLATREGPLFGSHPDARLERALDELGLPESALDLGAGTGRNTVPLARRGVRVDAVELAPALADALEHAAAEGALPVRVLRADALGDDVPIADGAHGLAVVAEVTSHFRGPADLRRLFERLARWLAPSGHALVSVFVADADYVPDDITRQLSQTFWTTFFTRDEIAAALSGLPFELVSDEPVIDYERAHLPAEAWPPTAWFERWAEGRDLFGDDRVRSPVTLRWLLYRRG